jgi:F-type H+-transporting ATPase subunit a
MGHSFNWITLIPWVEDEFVYKYIHVFTSIFILILLFIIGKRIKNNIKKKNDPLIPDAAVNTRNIFEMVLETIFNLMENVIGPHSEKYLPLIGGLFVYIFISNIMGLVPGFLPPTENINTNAGCSIIVFIMHNYYGIKEHGLGYIKQFAGPVLWLAPLMFIIELISHLFRPFSLAVRLFGNIFGDHLVFAIFSDLVPFGIPIIFLILGMVVSLIQAFVFSLLTMVYIALAVSHEH